MPEQIKPELLSPAGSMEALWAAINNGAVAVYLGASSFGARSTAGFDYHALKEAVRIAHFFGKHIYVTMNTLIKEREFEDFRRALVDVIAAGADAVLVQDYGALRMIKTCYPDLPVHASTQMTIQNLAGAQVAMRIGIDRVVFARETRLATLEKAAKAGIEVEVFVHGALCVAVSGQCTLSAMIGGRSGNRGRCAQPCRMDYLYRDRLGAWLSPRDISMAEHIPSLKAAGIASLKIEGRLKRPEYVAVVTRVYRQLLDEPQLSESVRKAYQQDLLQIFNRGGFSNGYVFGDQDASIMNPLHVSHEGVPLGTVLSCRSMGDKYLATIRLTSSLQNQDGLEIRGQVHQSMIYSGKDAVSSEIVDIRLHQPAAVGDTVHRLDSAHQLHHARNGLGIQGATPVSLDAALFLEPNKPARLTLSDGTTHIAVEGAIVQEAQRAPLSKENTEKAILKAGEYPVSFNSYSFYSTSPAFLPVSSLNKLRRDGLDTFYQARVENFPKLKVKSSYQRRDGFDSIKPFYANIILQSADIEHVDQYRALGVDSFFYAPSDYQPENLAEAINKLRENDALVLPRQTNDDTLDMLCTIANQADVHVVVNNIGQLYMPWPKGVLAGGGLHAWNNESLIFLKEQGFSSAALPRELTYQEQAGLSRTVLPLMLTVYGRAALMVLNHCPERVYRGLSSGHAFCRLCHQQQGTKGQYLKDRKGAAFPLYPLHLPEGCINYLLDEKPLHIGSKASPGDCWLLNMTLESTAEAQEIIQYYVALRQGESVSPLSIPYYHGRYQKGVE